MMSKLKRCLALALIAMLAVSMLAGSAAAVTLDEAKNSVATVNIQWRYSNSANVNGTWLGRDAGDTTPTDEVINTSVYATHDYSTDGDRVYVDYRANLSMTEIMAEYLCPRQSQLMRAEFIVTVYMDMEWLTFDSTADTVTVRFDSTFLKPNENPNSDPAWYNDVVMPLSFELVEKIGDRYYYEIVYDRADLEGNNGIRVPMELILAEVNGVPYGYNDLDKIPGSFAPMFIDYTVEDWMEPIYAEIAGMTVKSGMDARVTYDPDTWYWLVATGTIEGEFEYCTDSTVETVSDYAGQASRTLAFGEGDDKEIPAWYSYNARVLLKRGDGDITPPRPGQDTDVESPLLNLNDHYAYIIGYPDGLVHPEGQITRAEVATIFFRLLRDEVRAEYWSQTNPYNDVERDDWYNNAISTLTNLDIIEGYPDGSFRPNGNITRAEFATMAVRFFVITENYDLSTDLFTDIADHWANENINLAYLIGIINGYPDNTYRPDNAITRAEAMTIVNNTLRRTPCVEGMLPDSVMITWPDNLDKTIWYYPEVQEATNSHDYDYFANGDEDWTAPLPVRDWAALEREWSTAYSSANPGEVVDSSTLPVINP